MLRSPLSVAAVALVLVVGACSSGDADPSGRPGAFGDGPDLGEVAATFGFDSSGPTLLRSPATCAGVEAGFDWLAEKSGPGSGAWGRDGADAVDDSAGEVASDLAAPTADAAAESAPATNSSDTNTQEAGIDEPDLVETDGDVVYVVEPVDYLGDIGPGGPEVPVGETLVVLDAATGDVRSRLGLGSVGNRLLLQGDRLLAIGDGSSPYVIDGPIVEPLPEPAPVDPPVGTPGEPPPDDAVDADDPAIGAPLPTEPADPVDPVEPVEPPVVEPPVVEPPVVEPLPVDPLPFAAGMTVQLIDVADPAAPEVLERTDLDGFHVTTRVVDGVARIVMNSGPGDIVISDGIATDGGAIDSPGAEDSAGADHQDDVAALLPAFRTVRGTDAPISGQAVACDQVLFPNVPAGIGETSILRVDFDEGFDPSATTTIVAAADAVYASPETLYVAASAWGAPTVDGEVSTTVHAFDLAGDGGATHAATGSVPGHLLNQYALSEYEGHLRVATTEFGTGVGVVDADSIDADSIDAGSDSSSSVYVLHAAGGELVTVGSVGGLGVTETIQSVRFLGPTGYVVTFRQTDPLYVVDLSTPTDPVVRGELKIPGYSSHLQSIGGDRLIGIGRSADEQGMDTGFQVSLFDVSDPAEPRQLQTFTDPNGWSSAAFDPLGILWWPDTSTLAFPYQRDDGGRPGGVLVLDVGDGGITEGGLVSAGETQALRAMVVQDRLWSVFGDGVAISSLDTPADAVFRTFG